MAEPFNLLTAMPRKPAKFVGECCSELVVQPVIRHLLHYRYEQQLTLEAMFSALERRPLVVGAKP
jgi:hypothetical protein